MRMWWSRRPVGPTSWRAAEESSVPLKKFHCIHPALFTLNGAVLSSFLVLHKYFNKGYNIDMEKAPGKIGNFQIGQEVKILRKNGNVEDGWKIFFIDQKAGEAKVINEQNEQGDRRSVSFEQLAEWQKLPATSPQPLSEGEGGSAEPPPSGEKQGGGEEKRTIAELRKAIEAELALQQEIERALAELRHKKETAPAPKIVDPKILKVNLLNNKAEKRQQQELAKKEAERARDPKEILRREVEDIRAEIRKREEKIQKRGLFQNRNKADKELAGLYKNLKEKQDEWNKVFE